jgi:thioredoxin-related protein
MSTLRRPRLQPHRGSRARAFGAGRLLGFVAWLLATIGAAQAGQTRDPDTHFFDETFGDLREELEIARQEGKKGILIFFEQAECPFCHRMMRTVLNRSEVQDYFREHFRILRVDIEGDVEMHDFDGTPMKEKDLAFKRYRVRATPVFAFFDLDGRLIARHTGPTRNAEEFLWLGRYVVEGAYREMPFSRYKRRMR